MEPPALRMTRARAARASGDGQVGGAQPAQGPTTTGLSKTVGLEKPRNKIVTFKEPRKRRAGPSTRAGTEDGYNPDSESGLSDVIVAECGRPVSAGKQPGRPARGPAQKALEALQSCYDIAYMSGSDEFQQRKVKIVTEQNVV